MELRFCTFINFFFFFFLNELKFIAFKTVTNIISISVIRVAVEKLASSL
jgi:hypothetical protein